MLLIHWIEWSGHVYVRGSFHKEDGIILLINLIFKIWKIWNTGIGFVRNFILSNSSEIDCSDITVASFVNDKYGDITVESIP